MHVTAPVMRRRKQLGKWRGQNSLLPPAPLRCYVTTGPITGLFELGETDRHETAFRNVAASLAKITRRSQQAA